VSFSIVSQESAQLQAEMSCVQSICHLGYIDKLCIHNHRRNET